MDCSLPGSSVQGFLQARILEWVAISFSRGSSQPSDWTCISCFTGGFFTSESPGKPFRTLWSESLSVMSDSLRPHRLHSPRNSPGQNTGWGSLPLLQEASQRRDQIQVSHIAVGFFTSWATRGAPLGLCSLLIPDLMVNGFWNKMVFLKCLENCLLWCPGLKQDLCLTCLGGRLLGVGSEFLGMWSYMVPLEWSW